MAVAPGRRDQPREMVDQLQWDERHRIGAVALGSRQPVDDLFLIDELEALERERRAGTVTQPGRSAWIGGQWQLASDKEGAERKAVQLKRRLGCEGHLPARGLTEPAAQAERLATDQRTWVE